MPLTSLKAKVMYTGIDSDSACVSIKMGLDLKWNLNRDERATVGRYEVRIEWEKGEIRSVLRIEDVTYDPRTNTNSGLVRIGLLHHDIPADTTLSVRLIPVVLNRLGQPSSATLVQVSNVLILQSTKGPDTIRSDKICGMYFSQSIDETTIYIKHEDHATGPHWTEIGDKEGIVYDKDPTRISSKIRFVRRIEGTEYIVSKNTMDGTWNLFDGDKKLLSCKQIQDQSFPLDGWNDDVKFTKGMSLCHAMATSSSKLVLQMLEANSNLNLMISTSRKEKGKEEKEGEELFSDDMNLAIQKIVKRVNGTDRIRHSVSSLMNAVVKSLPEEVKSDSLLLQNLVATNTNILSTKEEEKTLETNLTAQNRENESNKGGLVLSTEDEDEKNAMLRMIAEQQRQTCIKTSRAKLFRLYVCSQVLVCLLYIYSTFLPFTSFSSSQVQHTHTYTQHTVLERSDNEKNVQKVSKYIN